MTDDDSSAPDPSRQSGVGDPVGPIHRAIPEGDNRERLICRDCGFIHYRNPVVVVGSVATWNDGDEPSAQRILLCRRAIAPQIGLWTLPAGYLELEETTEAGAVRETRKKHARTFRSIVCWQSTTCHGSRRFRRFTRRHFCRRKLRRAKSRSTSNCLPGTIFPGMRSHFRPCAGRCANIARSSGKPILRPSATHPAKAVTISDRLPDRIDRRRPQRRSPCRFACAG